MAREPGYLEGGLRDYRPRDPVFALFRREDDGHLTLIDLFSRRRLAEDVRDELCEERGDDPAHYVIEQRPVYVGMISGASLDADLETLERHRRRREG